MKLNFKYSTWAFRIFKLYIVSLKVPVGRLNGLDMQTDTHIVTWTIIDHTNSVMKMCWLLFDAPCSTNPIMCPK